MLKYEELCFENNPAVVIFEENLVRKPLILSLDHIGQSLTALFF